MNKIKIIAFYLPQFHAIPENDEWWGKGFTDWTNVRKGFVYAKGQEQPRIPLNDNYYDLTNVDTLRWQAKLMEEYNVYGQCIYHYWFDGKLLLEKPAELLLENKDIQMNFCFSWANEPWARTWDGKNSSVLMPQRYGDESDWKKHFEYLLPFFKDDRYIKENNCPMFIIYKSSSIKDCKAMMECWIEMAKEAGFDGVHFVETLRGTGNETRELPFKAKVEFEPARTTYMANKADLTYDRIRRRFVKYINKLFRRNIPLNRPVKFNTVADKSLALISPQGTYGGVFVGWDNTARKGLSSTLILPPSKKDFESFLAKKIEITKKIYKTEYLFINAWNEWAEGTYLEPDKIHKYDYLDAVKKVICNQI